MLLLWNVPAVEQENGDEFGVCVCLEGGGSMRSEWIIVNTI